MAKKGQKIKIALVYSVCKSQNYITSKKQNQHAGELSVEEVLSTVPESYGAQGIH